jgi:ribosomal-protein-alanine N-acetyltransferase
MHPEQVFEVFPTMKIGEDIILRQYHYADAEPYLAYMQDDEVVRFIPRECIPKSVTQTRMEIDYAVDLFRYKRSIYWAIARQEDNQLIGSCGFNYWNRDHARAEISYDLAKDYWQQGIMTRVVKAVLEFAFANMQLNRVEATVTPTNIGSLQVLEKIGFQREGLLREQKLLHGTFQDAIMLSLLKHDFR